jgi:hypothetical protein
MPRLLAPSPRPRRPAVRFRTFLLVVIAPALSGAVAVCGAEARLPTRVAADDLVGKKLEGPAVKPADGEPAAVAAHVDGLLADHWRTRSITPAPPADDEELLRRMTFDLAGRAPTVAEQDAYLAHPAATRRAAAIDGLLAGPEFALHFARVVDDWVQRSEHGDEAFVGWLRKALADGRSWSTLFERVMIGPWNDEADKPASRFLAKRAKNIDAMTADTARAFFGVDITCARCHDHPLVDDWKQDHYYGLAAFLHRTQAGGKDKPVGEKNDGELSFESRIEGQKTALPLYLTERAADPKAKGSRRAQLVSTVLEERRRFSRAAANRLWATFFGRGLVEPVDQMHSANPSSVPGLLELLADDLADHGYDLKRTARIIVLTRAYGLSGRNGPSERANDTTDAGAFAAATLRPLTPRQYALGLVLATGDAGFGDTRGNARVEAYTAAEKSAAGLLDGLDETVDGFRPGVSEALYLSNHEGVQKLFAAQEKNLAARLAGEASVDKRTSEAFRAVLARRPSAAEMKQFAGVPVGEMVWVLGTSVENRFNH